MSTTEIRILIDDTERVEALDAISKLDTVSSIRVILDARTLIEEAIFNVIHRERHPGGILNPTETTMGNQVRPNKTIVPSICKWSLPH